MIKQRPEYIKAKAMIAAQTADSIKTVALENNHANQ